MNKIPLVFLLTIVVISVVFTACRNKNNDGDNNTDNTPSPSDYATVNSNDISDTVPSAYGFEEDEIKTSGKDNNNVAVSTTSKNEPDSAVTEYSSKNEAESEENKPLLPPKSGSQPGEWGASVNN